MELRAECQDQADRKPDLLSDVLHFLARNKSSV